MELKFLIDEATAIAGSQSALARALGVPQPNVSQWRSGSKSCPDAAVLKLAKIAGRDPIKTAAAIYVTRLGKLTRSTLAGAGVTLLTLPNVGDVAPSAGLSYDNV